MYHLFLCLCKFWVLLKILFFIGFLSYLLRVPIIWAQRTDTFDQRRGHYPTNTCHYIQLYDNMIFSNNYWFLMLCYVMCMCPCFIGYDLNMFSKTCFKMVLEFIKYSLGYFYTLSCVTHVTCQMFSRYGLKKCL